MTNTITDQQRVPVRYLEDVTGSPAKCPFATQTANNETWWCKIATFGRDHLAGRWGMTALMVIGGVGVTRSLLAHNKR